MNIHPSLFIVRNEKISQNLGYGKACCEIMTAALAHQPPLQTFEKLYIFFKNSMMQKKASLSRHPMMMGDINYYGLERELSFLHDNVLEPKCCTVSDHGSYIDSFTKFATNLTSNAFADRTDITRLSKDQWLMHYFTDDGTKINLSKPHVMSNTILVDFVQDDVRFIQQTLGKLFAAVTNRDVNIDSKKTAIIDIYFLLSHYCPLASGSATLAKLTLNYCAEIAGIEIKPTKPNVNLNTIAILTPHGLFSDEFKSEVYFDLEVNPQEVFSWQQTVAAKIENDKATSRVRS